MKTIIQNKSRPLNRIALGELLLRVVRDSDRGALAEFHERAMFLADGQRLRFVEFIQWLAERKDHWPAWVQRAGILEITLDLLSDKFTLLPAGSDVKNNGPDVRFYLGACLRYLETDPVMVASGNLITRDLRVAEALQNLVRRHFVLSALEARRRIHVGVRRYGWKLDGRIIYLWLPKEMTAHDCRRWLTERLEDFQPAAEGLRDRVQARINSELWMPRILSSSDETTISNIESPVSPEKWSLDREISVKGLAEVVAQEKADTLALQRPAIQLLGPERLKQMVLRVFEDLASGSYCEAEIARAFGVSKPSLCRFAGSRWNRKFEQYMKVPDLYRNTAQTLSRHRIFSEAAKDAGVWPSVEAVLSQQKIGGCADDE